MEIDHEIEATIRGGSLALQLVISSRFPSAPQEETNQSNKERVISHDLENG